MVFAPTSITYSLAINPTLVWYQYLTRIGFRTIFTSDDNQKK